MFLFRACLILGLLAGPFLAEAQTLRKVSVGNPRRTRPHFKFAMGVETWQETMKLVSRGNEADMRAQSDGVSFIGKWVTPLGRWQRHYGGQLGLGRVKGKGSTAAVADELNDQSWLLLGAVGGYTYRTSPVSELGVSASALYRRFNWKLASDSDLDVQAKAFGLGLGFQYGIVMSKTSSIVMAATHQYFWRTTVWSIAYQASFR